MTILAKPISIGDVATALNDSKSDLGQLCKSSNINMWAKYTPIRYKGANNSIYVGELDNSKRAEVNYGMDIPYTTNYETFFNLGYWQHLSPRGITEGSVTYNEMFRLTDFDGYRNSDIRTTTVNLLSDGGTFKIYSNRNTTFVAQIDDADGSYTASELKIHNDHFYLSPYTSSPEVSYSLKDYKVMFLVYMTDGSASVYYVYNTGQTFDYWNTTQNTCSATLPYTYTTSYKGGTGKVAVILCLDNNTFTAGSWINPYDVRTSLPSDLKYISLNLTSLYPAQFNATVADFTYFDNVQITYQGVEMNSQQWEVRLQAVSTGIHELTTTNTFYLEYKLKRNGTFVSDWSNPITKQLTASYDSAHYHFDFTEQYPIGDPLYFPVYDAPQSGDEFYIRIRAYDSGNYREFYEGYLATIS